MAIRFGGAAKVEARALSRGAGSSGATLSSATRLSSTVIWQRTDRI
jgi:hypothetical protein